MTTLEFLSQSDATGVLTTDRIALVASDGSITKLSSGVLATVIGAAIFTANTPTSARWRLRFPHGSENNSYGVGITELQFLISGSNQCSGGTPFASGVDGSWSIAAAFDGTLNSGGWYSSSSHSGGIDSYLGYQFSSAITPDHFKWAPLHGFGDTQTDPSEIIVEYQDANGAWVPVGDTIVTGSTQDTLSAAIAIPSTFNYIPAPIAATDAILPWYGDQVGVCGDSISANTFNGVNWPAAMASRLHATVNNVAVSGNKMRDAVTQMGGLTLANNSVLLVMLGTNDYAVSGGTAYGTLGDTSASNTFYGDVDYVINTALAGNKKIALGFILEPRRYDVTSANGQGKLLVDYLQAIKDVCAVYSVPVLDLYATSGVNATTRTTLLGDDLHPTGDGAHIYERKISAFVRTL